MILWILMLAGVTCFGGARKLDPEDTTLGPGVEEVPPYVFIYEEFVDIPTSNFTEAIDVDIGSVFPGDVKWNESSDDNFGIYVLAYQERHDYTSETEPKVQLKASFTSGRLEIRINPMDPLPIVSLPLNGASFVSVNILCIMLAMLVSLLDHRVSLVLGIVASCTLVSCLDPYNRSAGIRCDVIIYYPRNVTFSNVSIVVPEGNITIPPKENREIAGDIWCSTNYTTIGCPFCCHGNGFCGPGNVCTCRQNYDNKTDCESEFKPNFKLYTGGMDPRLARFDSLDLYKHLIVGRRRDDGVPRIVTEIRSRDKNGNVIVIGLKKGKLIKDIVVTGGDEKRIQWINSCNILVTSADTIKPSEHKSTIINTCDARDGERKNESKKKRKRKKKDITILSIRKKSFETTVEKSSQKIVAATNADDFLSASFKMLRNDDNHSKWKKTFTKVPIDVKRCGEGDLSSTVYASVLVKESDSDMMPVLEYKAIADYYPGSFYVKVPAKQNTDKILFNGNAHPLRTCNHLRKASIKVCNKNKRLLASNISENCAALLGRTDRQLQNFSDDVRQSAKETCEQGYFALKSYCDNVAKIADSNLCLDSFSEQETFHVSEETQVIFSVVFPDGHTVRSPVYMFNSSAAHVTEKVVLEGTNVIPKILNFSINPPDPRPNQGYEAIIRYRCVSDTTKLHMRVEGDDSYSSDVTCRGNQQCNCCTLHVAGATAHVTDTVKIELSDSTSGVNITQEYRVIF